MKKLALLIPNGTSTLSSLVLTLEVFAAANEYFSKNEKDPVFEVVLVGSSRRNSITTGALTIKQQENVKDFMNADLIIVPALGVNIEEAIDLNKANIQWIIREYNAGAEVASLCTGAFILAATGILNGKQCSTHWSAANALKTTFPEIDLAVEKIITDENGIYTTGGALSSMNLILHLVEKYYNRQTAIYCAKVFEVDLDRNNQSAFIIFSGQKNHGDKEIQKAQLHLEKNVNTKVSFEILSTELSLERKNFDRRFKKATGNTPLEYFQKVRIEAAKKAFETTDNTINEVMYDVGYTDVKAFREIFKRITGISPVQYRNKYNKQLVRLVN